MHTLTIQIQDSFMQDFIDKSKESIHIEKDKNLEYDPYFYERQEELHRLRDDIESNKVEMLSQETYDLEINDLFTELKRS